MRQIIYLIKQELRSALRSKYILISFVFLPLLMWGFQGGVQVLSGGLIESQTSNVRLYITNDDIVNGNVTLPTTYELDFDFDGSLKGDNVSSLNLAKFLIAKIQFEAETDNNSALFSMEVVVDNTPAEVQQLTLEGKVDYWLRIQSGFAASYSVSNLTTLNMSYLPSSVLGIGPAVVHAGISQILSAHPFTIVQVSKATLLRQPEAILLGSDTETNFSIG
ncbi:MAG TPA: hypothetical protein VJ044_01300, partial [Candidatus Hodarchaeales archaeon]|nr:hypothetical protein [Candidatus Hodarchaeales archaeon]